MKATAPKTESSEPRDSDEGRRPAWADALVALALAAIVFAIYGAVAHHRFIYLDDDVYVFSNPIVQRGLTRDGLIWAFTQFHASNWHPLTWLSHMLDCRLFGATQDAAGMHHLMSVGIHAANAVLLFAALRMMTGAFWPCALVAALFAVHPLRVESVAWASERKDVLSGLFFMLTLLAYAWHARRPGIGRYAAVLAAAVLGLLSKPMLVTIPFVLLLLDVWPLRRWTAGAGARDPMRESSEAPSPTPVGRLLLEKLPLLAAAIGASAMTLGAQKSGGAVMGLEGITPAWRLVTTPVAYVIYLWKTVWPTGLAILYPHPATVPDASIGRFVLPCAGALLVLAFATALVWRQRRARPHLAVGWFWYLGMLVPVIGLLQVGAQFWADRYAYLPVIGVYVMLAWGVRELVAQRSGARVAVCVAAAAAIVTLAVVARAQVAVWRDSRTLFEHTLAVTRDNWMIENNLGAYLSLADPASDEARRHLEEALRINPGFPDALGNLAEVLFSQGRYEESKRRWELALRLRPDDAPARIGIANVNARQGNLAGAIDGYEQVLHQNPRLADAHANLGAVLAASGRFDEARGHFEEAYRLDPDSPLAQHLLARWLATAPDPRVRDPKRALELARRAAARTEYRRPEVLTTLASALAATGEFREAAAAQRKALALAPEADRRGYRQRLEAYEAEAARAR